MYYVGVALLLLLMLALLAALAVFAKASHKPDEFSLSRTAIIEAPQDVVFALINDFHQWENWSPWAHIDPTMVLTYGGPDSGTGATYHWTGKKKAGEGRMIIEESIPHRFIRITLDFIRPFKSSWQTTFDLTPEAGGTRVTWGMNGKMNMVNKVFSVFMDMEKMIGADYEKGLRSLNDAARSASEGP